MVHAVDRAGLGGAEPADTRPVRGSALLAALLPRCVAFIGLVHLANAALMRFSLGGEAAHRQMLVELCCAAYALSYALWLRSQEPDITLADRRAVVALPSIFVGEFSYSLIFPETVSYPALYIAVVAVSFALTSVRWFIGATFAFAACFMAMLMFSPNSLAAWAPACVSMLASVAIAAIVFQLRLRSDTLNEELWRKAELARQRAEANAAALQRSEMRFRALADGAADMIAEVGSDGRVRYANTSHAEVLGHPISGLLGRPFPLLHFERSVSTEDARAWLESACSPARESAREPVSIQHPDGSLRWVEVTVRRIDTTPAQSGPGFVVVGRDVTQRQHDEDALRRYQDHLEELVDARTAALSESLDELRRSERLASLGTLAAGISHQVNNPLAAILASAELALDYRDDPDELDVMRRALAEVVTHATRCGDIVRDVLQFGRDEPRGRRVTDLIGPVLQACRLAQPYANERNSELVWDLPEKEVLVEMSRTEIEEVCVNLLRNALESRDRGVHVSVSLRVESSSATISVRDDGRGLSESERARMFDPFFTTRLNSGGTGLGLSVAHGIVADHGGVIQVRSEKEKGTELTVRLPLCA